MISMRAALLTAFTLIGVCLVSVVLFVILDTILHVKIPYALVLSFFATAALMCLTLMIVSRESGGKVVAEKATSGTVFSGEERPESPQRPEDMLYEESAVAEAPIQLPAAARATAGSRSCPTATGTAACPVSLRGVILFRSTVCPQWKDAA
jgi:hypothetical protein